MKTDELLQTIEVPPATDGAAARLEDVALEANLIRAWDRVRRNDGAPGADGVTIADLEPQFPGLARHLSNVLETGRYRPKPVRRVEVPKLTGGTRKLGIPAVIDRVVQQAVLQVLQPIFEPHFSASSFAYRPGRGPLDAVRHIQRRLSLRSGWVLHFDVEDFFDSVPHARILGVVSRKVDDENLMRLIQHTLCCGVSEDGRVFPTTQGVSQGSPLSPLLANAVLDELDQWLDVRGAVFARYADDSAVLLDTCSEGERLKSDVDKFLSTLSLRLNQKKTTLTPAHQAEFLGFAFRAGRDGRCRRIISPGSCVDYQRAIQTRVSEQCTREFEERIASATNLFNSWLGYYGATEDPSQIDQISAQTEDALRLSEWRHWANPLARQRSLVARGVELDLARQASGREGSDPIVANALLKAFPAAFFRSRGLGINAVGKVSMSGCLDYSGRLQVEMENIGRPDSRSCPIGIAEWNRYLLESGWFNVSLQLARHREAFLPRVMSLSFELRCHRIVIHW